MSLTTSEVTVKPNGVLAEPRLPSQPSRVGRDAAVVGLVATLVGAAGASHPSFWYDEAATISASTRSLAELWRLVGHVDAVHALYYVLMHGWFAIFPVTEFWSRVPSCLAVGIAGAGVVVLARKFSGRPVALCAGLAFAILPRITWAGVEARSYAFTALAATWFTVLVVVAVRRNRSWLWLVYTVSIPIVVLLNVFLVVMIAVHAVALPAAAPRRSAVLRWVGATSIGAAIAAPFLSFSHTQFAQVSWISPLNGGTAVEVLRDQYFDGSTPFAIVVGVIMVAALVLRLLRLAPSHEGAGRVAVLAIAWIAIPTIGLLVYTALMAPIYYPRYLCFTTPALALLLGLCIATIARAPTQMTAIVVALTIAAAPNYVLSQRGSYKREGQDFSQVADVVTRHAEPGDCLLLDNTTSWKPGPIRPLLAARPNAFRKLVDVGRGRSARSSGWMWDGFIPLWNVADRVSRCAVLWTVSERDAALGDHDVGGPLTPGLRLGRAPVYQIPYRMGFRVVERWQFSFAQITKSTRGSFGVIPQPGAITRNVPGGTGAPDGGHLPVATTVPRPQHVVPLVDDGHQRLGKKPAEGSRGVDLHSSAGPR